MSEVISAHSVEIMFKQIEALQHKVELLESAIKETWSFINYNLPLSLEAEILAQPTLTESNWSVKAFAPVLNATLKETVRLLQETNAPVHYSVIVEAVKKNHREMLLKGWTDKELGDKAHLDGKVRQLKHDGYLTLVGKGMYFYGEKLTQQK